MENLPSHRRLINSLVASLCQPAASLPPSCGAGADRRLLLLTLHVLFPSIVLPALDLLDRKLVTRIRVAPERGSGDQPSLDAHCRDPDGLAEDDQPASRDRPASSSMPAARVTDEVPLARLYIVQSLASTLARPRGRDPASPLRTYAIHLDAWSCSCASFTLEAFASHVQLTAGILLFTSRASPSSVPRASPQSLPPKTGEAGRVSFGGLSTDGLLSNGEHVPCCKHLLACLLAETWPTLLRNGIDDRLVTSCELAGVAAGIH